MSGCVKCGHDPDAVVAARWEFVVPREVKSANDRINNARNSNWAYAAQRAGWQRDFTAMRLISRIPLARGKRRVTLTRLYTGRQREWDPDNFVGGAKSLVDAMVRAALIFNDTSAYAQIFYAQSRAATPGLRVLLEELA